MWWTIRSREEKYVGIIKLLFLNVKSTHLYSAFFFFFFYFTILYWFCHTSTCIHHGCIHVPHPEPPSHLPPHTIPLGHPSAPALSILYHASSLVWRFVKVFIYAAIFLYNNSIVFDWYGGFYSATDGLNRYKKKLCLPVYISGKKKKNLTASIFEKR